MSLSPENPPAGRSKTREHVTGSAIGMRVPAYCSAAGRAWLASLSDTELDSYFERVQLKSYTTATQTHPDAIRKSVALVAEKGYSIVEQELELGTLALAVPVVNNAGAVVAALAVSTSMTRKSRDELIEVGLPQLRSAASILEEAV